MKLTTLLEEVKSTLRSSVDFLESQYNENGKLTAVDIYQAKMMEKQRIINAWDRGKYIGQSFPEGQIEAEFEQDAEEYYDNTYKSK